MNKKTWKTDSCKNSLKPFKRNVDFEGLMHPSTAGSLRSLQTFEPLGSFGSDPYEWLRAIGYQHLRSAVASGRGALTWHGEQDEGRTVAALDHLPTTAEDVGLFGIFARTWERLSQILKSINIDWRRLFTLTYPLSNTLFGMECRCVPDISPKQPCNFPKPSPASMSRAWGELVSGESGESWGERGRLQLLTQLALLHGSQLLKGSLTETNKNHQFSIVRKSLCSHTLGETTPIRSLSHQPLLHVFVELLLCSLPFQPLLLSTQAGEPGEPTSVEMGLGSA